MQGNRGLEFNPMFFRRLTLPRALLVATVLLVPLTLSEPAAKEQSPPPKPAPAAKDASKPVSLIFGNDGTLWAVFQKGGWVMWCILGCSVIGLTFFFERAIELRRHKHVPLDFDKDIVHAVDTRGVDAALALCLEKNSSLARVLYAALLRFGTIRQEMETAI